MAVLGVQLVVTLFTLWLWTKPVARDFLYQAPTRNMTFSVPSEGAFDSLRLWVLVALCLLRLAVTRPHLQAYLCLAKARVEQLRKEAGRIEAREIQQRVVRVYCYVTVVSLQYLTPLILTLHCTLLLKTLGGYSWALSSTPPPLACSRPSSSEACWLTSSGGQLPASCSPASSASISTSTWQPLSRKALGSSV